MTPEEREIRRILWVNHGHQMIYGDDGEMQCGECMILDFKRDSFSKIAKQMVHAAKAEQKRKDAEIARKMDESRFYLGRGKTIAGAILTGGDK